jgi:hypothetical protein
LDAVPRDVDSVKIAAIILSLFLSLSAFADPGEKPSREARRLERKKARIERQVYKLSHPYDERSRIQKKRDLTIVLFLALGAGLAVKSMSGE